MVSISTPLENYILFGEIKNFAASSKTLLNETMQAP